LRRANTHIQVNHKCLIESILGEVWKKHSKLVKDFISALMEFNPEKRLTAKEALEHEWIKKIATMPDVDTAVTAEAFKNLSKFRVIYLVPKNFIVRVKIAIGRLDFHSVPTF
jgi:serine/threonine protein kinase